MPSGKGYVMSMSKVAVVGPRDSILAFRALGADIFPATSKESALSALNRACDEGYGVVFITEALTQELGGVLEEYLSRQAPVITVIPDNRGSLGLGLGRIKQRVEKAIGVDILFKGEKEA